MPSGELKTDPGGVGDPAAGADRGADIQRALRERPSFSIRARIGLGFLLLFLLSLGISIASLLILNRVEQKLLFLEAAGSYLFELQQARRFEKNFFLYGTNVEDALEHVRAAKRILHEQGGDVARVVGRDRFVATVGHVERYEELLQGVARGVESGEDAGARARRFEAELRAHGAEMVLMSERLVAKERESINTMLDVSRRIPIVFLVLLLLLSLYLANFLARQILAPLNRLMQDTRRIAQGVFTPIPPRRRYRDELSELAMALNHMMRELAHRQDLLVQAHKLKAIGTLAAGVAHELNNPLNNIMLTAESLREDWRGLSDDDRLDMVRDLVDQSERARRIIRNLLDFTRESEMKADLLQVNDLVTETLALVSNQVKIARVKVVRRPGENLPPVHGDRQQLNQVLLNLFLNAIDAMSGGGTLTVTTTLSPDRDFVVIEVTDTGVGIPDHVLPNIFDPFFTTKPQGKGTGLGLSVSLGIVRHHGGDIQVHSRAGQGTTFEVLLPVARVPA